ncbi:MAG: hypothetical protein H7Y86_10800 [Rhizobacter sp.]|nr:hypothetical protein [Ferruginibacter sp.]
MPGLDTLLTQVRKDWQQKNSAGIAQFLFKTDQLLAPVQKEYPLFTGIFHLHQAYYAATVMATRRIVSTLTAY